MSSNLILNQIRPNGYNGGVYNFRASNIFHFSPTSIVNGFPNSGESGVYNNCLALRNDLLTSIEEGLILSFVVPYGNFQTKQIYIFNNGTTPLNTDPIEINLGYEQLELEQGKSYFITYTDNGFIIINQISNNVINSASDYASGNPLIITSVEGEELSKKFYIGQIVWDNDTKQHYVFNSVTYDDDIYYCWSKPTVASQEYKLNRVDENDETLTLENSIQINLEQHYTTYLPINSQPDDWDINWNKYYIITNNSYVLNTSDVYNTNEKYYIKTIL